MSAVWLDAIREGANQDGGWGTHRGMPSNTESTALCAFAMRRSNAPDSPAMAARAAEWLAAHQAEDGSWPFMKGAPSGSWSTSLAAMAVAEEEDASSETVRRGIRWLVRSGGETPSWLERLRTYLLGRRGADPNMDIQLRGWSWAPGTFSWVEPTAFALVALGRFAVGSDDAEERIDEGRRMVLDRTCPGGGWNYGNTRILGEDTTPYPDTTALGLIALQGSPRGTQVVQGLDVLARLMEEYRSGLTLSLSALCYRIYDRDASHFLTRLEASWRDNAFMGETRTLALAALAASTSASPFEVAVNG